jgi:hypothetical protein
MTPEGKIKKNISLHLRQRKGLWYNMPVPGGYGTPTLDYFGCYRGRFFAIEAKAPGKKPTDRQRLLIELIAASGGKTFVIDSEDISELKAWIEGLSVT